MEMWWHLHTSQDLGAFCFLCVAANELDALRCNTTATPFDDISVNAWLDFFSFSRNGMNS